jgi:hypothetical protein
MVSVGAKSARRTLIAIRTFRDLSDQSSRAVGNPKFGVGDSFPRSPAKGPSSRQNSLCRPLASALTHSIVEGLWAPFEPMAIAGAERFRANPLSTSQRARPARGSRLLDRDRRPRLGVLFWCRSQASQSSPRRKAERSRLRGEPPASLIALITDNEQAVVDALQRAEAEADRWRFVLREKSDLVMRARGLPEYESRCEAYGIILAEILERLHARR